MKFLFFELRKSWLKVSTFVFIILFIIINIYKANEYLRFNKFDSIINTDAKHRQAFFTLYDQLKGEITTQNIEYIQSIYFPLAQEVESMLFNTEYDENRYTGYVFGDYNLFRKHIIPQMEYAILYENFKNQITNRAKENINFYSSHNNLYEVEKNMKIYNSFENRSINEYRLNEWAEVFFTYDFSSLLIIILIILGISSVFSLEYESGMNNIIKTTNKSKKIIKLKLISLIIFVVFITIVFTISDLVFINYTYKIDGWLCPIYSIGIFKESPFNFSILTGIIMVIIMKSMAFISLALLFAFISSITKTTILSTPISFLFAIVLIILNDYVPSYFNPISMLTPIKHFESFVFINILGHPFLSVFIAFTSILLISAMLFILIIKTTFRR